jgi:hypothetical protein
MKTFQFRVAGAFGGLRVALVIVIVIVIVIVKFGGQVWRW